MCGIVGSINNDLSNEVVQLTCHRGPDEFGLKKILIGSFSVQLFHHRLSILDLSNNGSQPMTSSDGQGIIIFNGEIYNHLQLRDTLKNVHFKGHSDTETLVNFCRKECTHHSLSKLNGIFGFAYLDITNKKIFLARDRFGIKPLYYHFKGNQLLFSSEIRTIISEVEPRYSIGVITTALQIRHVPAPQTLLKDIFKVEPGQLITIDLDDTFSISKSYYADLPRKKRLFDGTKKRLVVEYGQLLEKAVERQLLSDVEVGVFLSGGVDSSLIAAIAKTKVENIKGFTVGFDDKLLDERASASETASYLNIEHYTEEVKFDNFFEEFEHIVNIIEEPADTGSIFPMYALSKLAASKVKVVLSGQGADEPLGGYNKYKALPAVDFLVKAPVLPRLFGYCAKYIKHRDLRRIFSSVGSSSNLDAYFEFNSLFGNHALHELMNKNEIESVSSKYYSALRNYHTVLKSKNNLPLRRSDLFPYLDTRTKLPETLLNYTDKITMHFGLECRVPMLDNDLVEFIESLPRKYRYSYRNGKIIHKEFARNYLPEEMVNRKKLAFHGPSKDYIRRKSAEIKVWLIQNDNRFFWRIFNKDAIIKLVDEHALFGNREKEIILIISTILLTSKQRTTSHANKSLLNIIDIATCLGACAEYF
ncbi:asparagine synthase (glutamine-hydrolyzing) [Segetibacter aerophilus]|uniref:asparagine synthase (glutamine-hydrolyzing) n=1 Tax=Segetibacter aerophilus TaxID=670293 RepID=A0A512B896_9BACT|nr:asparagine synthase (glutamine-hydrolyzing) [Segetibacter aerophilus]GEO08178.1 asparagine synthetase B [Segetibacter aerophilus]